MSQYCLLVKIRSARFCFKLQIKNTECLYERFSCEKVSSTVMNLQSHIFLKEILDDFQLGKSRP